MTNNLTILPKNKQIWLRNLVINYLMPSSSSSFSFLCPLVCIINIFLLSSLILPNATVNDSSYEMLMVEGNVCERQSKTWTGFCGNSGHCNSQCRIWEGAQHGACHAQFPGFACFCYFTC
ncbi:defensin-like protein 19 isoform X1 [Quercus lobata]|uniref:defensin-like protein 19 isoform X1 n=1 Tax=Quercus lobata TaxID=97700 RepID=UPI00124911D6|nr:defensin-like protein 19 isoform X1 [Quercus lobata]